MISNQQSLTAAVITTGEKSDGKQLQTLTHKSRKTGMEIDTVIGDAAYSEKENIQYANENQLQLLAKSHPFVTLGNRKKEDEFEFNKDAGLVGMHMQGAMVIFAVNPQRILTLVK